MEKKTQSMIMLILLLTTMLTLNFQQFRIIPEVMGDVASVPDFVNDNVVILEGGASPQWLDPHVSYYQYDYGILQHSVEMLLWYNGSNATQIIPWLTESWTPSYTTAAYTYTVKLRQGIKFQDGTPLNSTAVWFSLNRLLIIDGTSDTEVHGSQAAWIIQQLLDTSLSAYFTGGPPNAYNYDPAWVKKVLDQEFIEIIDNYTFKINVQMRTTQFPYLFSQPWAAIVSPSEVIKKEYAFHNWGSPSEALSNMTKYFIRAAGEGHTYYNVPRDGWRMGTGPYYLDSYDPVSYRLVLKVNSNYWGGPENFQYPIGTPRLQEIDFDYVESFTTRLLDLKAGKTTGIGVSSADIYSIVDRDAWLVNETFKSLIPEVTVHGPFTQFTTDWFNFITNTTDATGKLRTFQPMADRKIRLAIACAVNLTEINLYVNNRLGQVANNLIPPGTAPQGSYNPAISPPWSYNLRKAAELLVDAMLDPLTSFTFYNGTAIPSGLVDNSFGDTNGDGKVEKPYTIEMYVGSADILSQRILTTIATNLNLIARDAPGGNATGLTFTVVPVPGGQQFTLASKHQIYMYWGGWVADYNHVLDWLGPMYLSTGTYFAWNNFNLTALDYYVNKAYEADAAGDLAGLLQYADLANKFADDNALYFYTIYPLAYFVRSSYLEGWYYNGVLGFEYFAPMYYSNAPVAAFTYSPLNPYVGGTVVFDASGSYDPDGAISSYQWNFGDGALGSSVVTTHLFATDGTYSVSLTVVDNDGLSTTLAVNVTVARSSNPLDVQVEVGSIHFRGEMAEFYISVSSLGNPVDADITARLYYCGAVYEDLSTQVEKIGFGLYRLPYIIAVDASPGTYALVVEAGNLNFRGTAIKSFLLSPTLSGWNAVLLNINGSIGTVKTDIGMIMVDINNINAKIVALNNTMATVQTTIGTITTDIANIKLKLTAINGTTATIQTTLGVITGTITSVQGDVATIKTDVGIVKAILEEWKGKKVSLITPKGSSEILVLTTSDFEDPIAFSGKVLTISLSGQSGTSGSTSIAMPKQLLEDLGSTVEKIAVTIDDKKTVFTCSEQPEAYILSIAYTHSKHTMKIYLAGLPPTPLPWTLYLIATAIIALSVITSLAIYVMKIRKRSISKVQ